MEFLLLILAIIVIQHFTYRSPFGKPLVYITGIIGVPVHEFGHFIFCKLMGKKVTKVCWFQPPVNGTLGYVEYLTSNSLTDMLKRVVISLAPLVSGTVAIWGITQWFGFSLPTNAEALGQYIVDKTTNIDAGWIVYCWLLSSIMLHMLPSWADIKQAALGVTSLAFFLVSIVIAGFSTSLIVLYQFVEPGVNFVKSQMSLAISLILPIFLILMSLNLVTFLGYRLFSRGR
ncbi:hypothetical protein [uncultured Photobacterium sp.]|uniref:hypothetical protein n=1 Tax=uncultured Photobacterium sp. TaxID=173973 RepID=UPI00261CD9FA|nr:hypothetical protein [uncultured Photobacterium sp.]